MKKILFTLSFAIAAASGASAQSASSIANGNWTNPLTWNCTCVPTPGYSVTISHSVTLNTSFSAATGGLTITSGGSLIQDNNTRDIWINGGSLTNDGTLDVRYLYTQTGVFNNSGLITARAFMNSVNFTNTGTFTTLDSMYNTLGATITNNGSFLNIDSITNAGAFINNGISTYNQVTNNGTYANNNSLTFTDITNNGILTNADTLITTNSGWNLGNYINQAGAYMLITKSFLNDDVGLHDAVFTNNGKVDVLDSWYNMDTVKGSGFFTVQDSSYNSGYFKGTFSFCDLTPPASAPYVDFNLGLIEVGITWCNNAIQDFSATERIQVYPNPAADYVNVLVPDAGSYTISIYDVCGAMVLHERLDGRVRLPDLRSGIYTLRFETAGFSCFKKLQIIK